MIFLFTLLLSASAICESFTPKDHYLLFCGPPSNSATGDSTFDGRFWSHDENSTFASPSSFSTTVTAVANRDPGLGSPFMAARIFKSSFTYSFPVSPGPKFLRLFFYPTLYDSQYDASWFFFSVQANDHLLLRNFSAQLAVDYAPSTVGPNSSTSNQYVMKEYYIPIGSHENSLNLTFYPMLQSSHGFVNGIEVVSVPDSLYVTGLPIENVESSIEFTISNSSAFETAYRLNVGGSDVWITDDSIYRMWKNDDPYSYSFYGEPGFSQDTIKYMDQVPNYTAPETVYQTFKQLGYGNEQNRKLNLTWSFKVDPGFTYMVRLHWCELDFHINKTGDRIFEVYINSLTAESSMDVMKYTDDERDVPYYKDYIVFVPEGNGGGGHQDLWIALHPNTQFLPTYYEVLLNGLEIFKMDKPGDGSLDAPNPQVPQDFKFPPKQVPITRSPKRSHYFHQTPSAVCTVFGVLIFIILLTCLLIFRYSKGKKESASKHICRKFSLAQVRQATNDFHEGLIIGRGGFGNVYKGMVDEEKGPLAVAIKRLNPSSKQGVREFMNEIAMLSTLRHAHLVSLIGYCNDDGEMILVYEHMEQGTLRDHLYNTNNVPLSWVQRLNACLGAAKGLQFLHSGASHTIIHRDVKSTNILLDEQWVAKLSDFGISKLGPMDGGDVSHISTAVKGSIGYLDPEYYKFRRLTEKSDVYSFGAVLLEVLCGRAVVVPSLTKEQVNLVVWAQICQRRGALDVIVDRNIKGEITAACLKEFGELAMRCVSKHGTERPSMVDVVGRLELVPTC